MATTIALPASEMTRVYLDHASTSPLRPAALEAMLPYLHEHFGDPGRVHSDGLTTRVAIEHAREQVALLFGARPREVLFTSGHTEAVNTAIYGSVRRDPGRTRVVTTAVEHSSVLDACRREPGVIIVVGVDGHGRVAADALLDTLTDDTALVSVQLANHEVGTFQPVPAIVAGAHDRGLLVHVDASAAAGNLLLDFAALGADLMSIGAHSWGGPLGAGALLIRRGLRIPPFMVGGAQERARRAGIENVPAIVGFGAAAAELTATQPDEADTSARLTDRIRAELAASTAGLTFYGHPTDRLSNIVCFAVDGVEAEPILLALDQHGIAIHSGSACSSESLEPSPVLIALGADAEHALRVSVGWTTTDSDIEHFVNTLPGIIDRMRALRPS